MRDYAHDFVAKICERVFESFLEGAKGVVATQSLDSFADAYASICDEFVERYIEVRGALDEGEMEDFRRKFMRILCISVTTLDEIDTRVGGIVVERWDEVKKLMRRRKRTEFIVRQKRKKLSGPPPEDQT